MNTLTSLQKLTLSTLLIAGVAGTGFSQGTLAFQNFSNTGGGLIEDNPGIPYVGSVSVELFWGPVGSTVSQLLALNNGVVFSTTMSTAAPGKFFDGTTVNTTLPAGTGTSDTTMNAELVIAAWTGNAANYAAALGGGSGKIGISLAFANPTGGAGTPPSNPAGMINWTLANSVVFGPEPSTLALGGLGGAVLLLMARRRKI